MSLQKPVFHTKESYSLYTLIVLFFKNPPNPVVWDFINNNKYEQLNNYIEGHYYHKK